MREILLIYLPVITLCLVSYACFHSLIQHGVISIASNALIYTQCEDPMDLEVVHKYLNMIPIDRIYTIIATILHVAAGIVAMIHFRKERPVLVMLLVVTLLGVALSAVAFYYLHESAIVITVAPSYC